MTTLPQTTGGTLRLPRTPAVGGPLASPQGGPMAPPQAGVQMTGADVWRVIRSNIWLIILSLVFAVVAGYALNWYLARKFPQYTSSGVVQVIPNFVFNPMEIRQEMPTKEALLIEQRSHAHLMTQEALFGEVLANSPEVRETGWFKSFNNNIEEAKESLRDNFSVAPIPDTRLIRVAMKYRDPRDAQVILTQLVSQHIRNERDRTQHSNNTRGQALSRMQSELSAKRRDKMNEIYQLQVELNLQGGSGIPGAMNPKDLELMELVKRQLEVRAEYEIAKSQLDGVMETLAQGMEPPAVEEMLSLDPMVMKYRQEIDQVDFMLASASAEAGGDAPRMKMLKDQKAHLQQKLEDYKAEIRATAKGKLREGLQAQMNATDLQIKAIQERIETLRQDMGGMRESQIRYLKLADEEKELAERMAEIEEQLAQVGEMQRQSDLTGVAWMTHPNTPEQMSFPKLPLTMAAAIFLGLAFSLGIAFLRELLDTSVRSPRDIVRVGSINLLAMITDEADDPQAAGAKLPLVIAEAPHSMMAEQFRQLRTRLHQTASLDTTRSILVTSPGPDDGKSTVATNLAAGLALNGRRILLVDANFRRPALHAIFRQSNDRGFGDVLNAPEEMASLVRETDIPNLYLLPAGQKPANPTELLESQLLIDFIDRCLDEYDHVIFDSGPLLFVSDTVAMAPRMDGVITVVRARTNSRGVLQRMRDDLRKLRAEHLGVVLNAVRGQAGGYYQRNIKTYYEYTSPRSA